jgi:predicted nucleic acid-binding protein
MGWLDPLRFTVVALDTAPLIYFIEKHPSYLPVQRPFFEAVHIGEIQTITSTLTITEVLVLPLRKGNADLVSAYGNILMNSPNLSVLPVDEEIATDAARIRADYGLKVPDAVQIATARRGKATAFLTNDATLKSIPGIPTILLDRLRGQP